MFYLFRRTISESEVNQSCFGFRQGLSLPDFARKPGLFLYALGIIGVSLSWQSASAQTFDVASSAELNTICGSGGSLDSELQSICDILTPVGTPTSAGVGTQSQPNSILISQQQLKKAQTSKEKEDMVPGSADVHTTQWDDKLSTFFTIGTTDLRHSKNKYEQAYDATIPSVTLGGSYLFSDQLEAGLAFNYSNTDADFNTGGGFDVDSYSPLLYIYYLPSNHSFTSLVLSYTRQEQDNDRIAVADTDPSSSSLETPIRKKTKGDFDTDLYSLNFLGGYDFIYENFTFGPRVGVNATHWEMDSYRESSNTGLELSYNSQSQTSIQTTLGLSASSAHRLESNMVLVPNISVSWVHEYDNDSRTIRSKFVQAPDSAGFSFKTERPARDWAVIDLGASLVIQKNMLAFFNFSTVQGNSNFESYSGNLGIRIDL